MMIGTQKIPYIKKYRDTNSVAENIGLPRKVAQRLGKDARFAEEWIISLLNALLKRELMSNQMVEASLMNTASRSVRWIKVK